MRPAAGGVKVLMRDRAGLIHEVKHPASINRWIERKHIDVRFVWSDYAENFSIREAKGRSRKSRCYAGIMAGYSLCPIVEICFDGMRRYPKLCAEGITCDLIHELCHWAGLEDRDIPW